MHAQRWVAAAVIGSMIAGTACAQAVQLKRRGATTGTGTVTVTRQGDSTLVTIKATNADAKSLYSDIGTKAGAHVLVAPSISGRITSTVDGQSLETALQSVGASSGLAVRKLLVPQSAVATLKAPAAAALAASLTASVSGATVIDPATGRSVTITSATTAPKQTTDQVVVYLVVRAKAGADPVQTAIADASESLSGLTTEQKMQALRDLQRQAFESMTPEEMLKMRQNGPPMGGPGGPGGPGGNNSGQDDGGPGGFGGPPPGGMDGGPGGPPPGQ